MALPDIWHYHPDSKVLLGPGQADPSPAEEDAWLIPAHATDIKPPAFTGTPPSFIDGAWTVAQTKAQIDDNIIAAPSTLFGGPSIREVFNGQ